MRGRSLWTQGTKWNTKMLIDFTAAFTAPDAGLFQDQIRDEMIRRRKVEEKPPVERPSKGGTGKHNPKLAEKIMAFIKENGEVTTQEVADAFGVTRSASSGVMMRKEESGHLKTRIIKKPNGRRGKYYSINEEVKK